MEILDYSLINLFLWDLIYFHKYFNISNMRDWVHKRFIIQKLFEDLVINKDLNWKKEN